MNWWRWPQGGIQPNWRDIQLAIRSVGRNLGQHWALATFSLVAAFAIWFVVQDVENPQVTGFVPPDPEPPAITVQTLNVPNGYVVAEPNPIRVKVQTRKDDLANLTPNDFTASIDLKNATPSQPVTLPIHVTPNVSGVHIIGVSPDTATVTVEKAATKQMDVSVNIIAPLPSNYQQTTQPVIDPTTVKVSGLPDLVASVSSVVLDVDLSNVRSDRTIQGNLIAQAQNGTPVTVTLTPSAAKATFSVTQTFEQRTLGLVPTIVGTPAPGYRVTAVVIDPATVTVSGPTATVDALQSLVLSQLDVTGAKTDVTGVKQIDVPSNLSVDRQTVRVTAQVSAINCAINQTASPCQGATFTVAPTFSAPPSGLAVAPGTKISLQVQVYGPLDQIAKLSVDQIKATIDLSAATAGSGTYPVTVSLPTGLAAAPISPVSVTVVKAASS